MNWEETDLLPKYGDITALKFLSVHKAEGYYRGTFNVYLEAFWISVLSSLLSKENTCSSSCADISVHRNRIIPVG